MLNRKKNNLEERKIQIQKLVEEIDLRLNTWYFPYSMELTEIKTLFTKLLKVSGYSQDKLQTSLFFKK